MAEMLTLCGKIKRNEDVVSFIFNMYGIALQG